MSSDPYIDGVSIIRSPVHTYRSTEDIEGRGWLSFLWDSEYRDEISIHYTTTIKNAYELAQVCRLSAIIWRGLRGIELPTGGLGYFPSKELADIPESCTDTKLPVSTYHSYWHVLESDCHRHDSLMNADAIGCTLTWVLLTL